MDGNIASPLLQRRATHPSTNTTIRILGLADSNKESVVYAFGKTYKQLKSVKITREPIPSGQPFLEHKEVKNILKNGRQALATLLDYEKSELGYKYGLLGQAVDEFTWSW